MTAFTLACVFRRAGSRGEIANDDSTVGTATAGGSGGIILVHWMCSASHCLSCRMFLIRRRKTGRGWGLRLVSLSYDGG